MDFNTRLITEVKKYTMLYNMSSQGYFNVKKKERVWSLISKRLNTDINICKAKWKSLRDMHMRFKKRLEGGKPPANNRPWKYYEMLDFLSHYTAKLKVPDWDIIIGEDKDGNKLDNVNHLIEEIKKYPELYAKTAQGYGDRETKEKIWKEISDRIQIDVLSCKQKWKGLRDSYKRFQKRAHKSDMPKWKYYDYMLFLDDISLNNSLTQSDYNNDDDDDDNDSNATTEDLFGDEKKIINWEETVAIDEKGDPLSNTHRLIKVIEKYSQIYTSGPNTFEDREAREKAWKLISEELQMNEQSCRSKWKGLRDSYKRCEKKIDVKTQKWKYFDDLHFLGEALKTQTPTTITSNNSFISDPLDVKEDIYDTKEDAYDAKEDDIYEQDTEMDVIQEQEIVQNDTEIVEEEFLPVDQSISSSSTQIIETKNAYILTIPETNSNDYVCLDIQNATNHCIEEDEEDKHRLIDDQTEEVPILYLRSEDDSSNDSFSLSCTTKGCCAHNHMEKEENFSDLFKSSLEDYKTYSRENHEEPKDSVTILFESLAYSIKNSKLPENKLVALQADICSYAYGQLAEYKLAHRQSKKS